MTNSGDLQTINITMKCFTLILLSLQQDANLFNHLLKDPARKKRLTINGVLSIDAVMGNIAKVAIHFTDLTVQVMTETPAYIVSFCFSSV